MAAKYLRKQTWWVRFYQAVGAANGLLQIIVLDHAPREVWGGIPHIVEFEEWRGGRKLVPQDWLIPS